MRLASASGSCSASEASRVFKVAIGLDALDDADPRRTSWEAWDGIGVRTIIPITDDATDSLRTSRDS